MQWRAIGQLCDIPFGTLYTLFARWTRLAVAPPAQPLDPGLAAGLRRHSRTQRRHPRQPLVSFSAELASARGFDGGKKIKGIKIHLAVDKYGFPLAINVSPANRHDSKGIVPVLHQLAGRGSRGPPWAISATGASGFQGRRGARHHHPTQRRRHGGTFIPEGIRWVVERSLAWISRYRRLNTIFERTEGHLVAFIEIAFISILSRRLVRLVTQEISA